MATLFPKIASELAADVYAVQDEDELEVFLMRSEFSENPSNKVHLQADVGGRIIRNAVDGFGVCAVGGAGYENDIFLMFRGSTHANNGADWVSNFKLGLDFTSSGRPAHVGFLNIFRSMQPQIEQFLSQNSGRQGTIHCVGHSLGGAVASIAADWVKSFRKTTDVKLYTFGAPKPGMMLFSSGMTSSLGKENIYRVYHATDPVPMIPLFPFVHPPFNSYGHYIPSSENILSAAAHDMINYKTSVSKSTWSDMQRRAPQFTSEHAVEEWLNSKIKVDPGSSKTWQWLNEALIYVLKKIIGPALGVIQAGITGLVTIADKLAWILVKAKDLIVGAWDGSVWLLRLMQKAMQALGMKVIDSVKNLTQAIIKTIIERLMEKTVEVAKRAIQCMTRPK